MKQKISVIGAGTMGTGIAQVAATHGCTVNLIDSAPDALHHSKSNLHSVLNRLIEKVKISEADSKNILSKMVTYLFLGLLLSGFTYGMDQMHI